MRYKFNIYVFFCVLALFTALMTLFPIDKQTIETENRLLNNFPIITADRVLSGDLAGDFEAYLSDRIGFRSSIVKGAHTMEKLHGFAPGGVRVTNNTLALPNRLMEIFTDSDWYETCYAQALVAYREALPEETRVFSILVPTPIEFTEPRYKSVSDPQRPVIDKVNEILRGAGIITVDIFYELEAHKDEYIFFNTDHHWTMLGAYYGYLEFARAAGIEPIDITKYVERSVGGFHGYLNKRVPNNTIEPDTIVWYEYPKLVTTKPLFYVPGEYDTVTYGLFLEGDQKEYITETNSDSEKTAVIVKDSYGSTFIPWLAPHYKKIVAIDPRTFQGSITEKALQYENLDFIFINYVPATTYIEEIIDNITRTQ